MSTILLQLEAALADARVAQEQAAEKLHDTGVAHALAKSQYDSAADAVRRVEGALNSMHGVTPVPPLRGDKPIEQQLPAEPKPKKRRDEGPACPSCGAVGKMALVMRGTMRMAQCGECNAEVQAA